MAKRSARNITIKDIARMAGVSAAAVSYVMNGKGGVSEDKAALIKKIIKETGYSPNLNSQRLATGKSFNIHVVMNLDETKACYLFYFEVLLDILKIMDKHEYSVTFSSQSMNDINSGIVSSIKNNNVDGFLFFESIASDIKREIDTAGLPFVIINPCYSGCGENCVLLDFASLAYNAVKYLISCGHERIAFFSMKKKPFFFETLLLGYKKALKEYSLSVRPEYIFDNVTDESSSAAAVETIAAFKEPPTAVFCSQDAFAVGGMKRARELGFSLPEDMSFFGLDDIDYAKYVHPSLTTIHISRSKLAEYAVRMLMDVMRGKNMPSATLPVEKITVRDSVRIY